MPICGGSLRGIVHVEDGRGESAQVILIRAKWLPLSRVGEGLHVQFWVVENGVEANIVKRTLNKGLESVAGGRGGGPIWGVGWGHKVR